MGDKVSSVVNAEASQMPKRQKRAYFRWKDAHTGGNIISVGSAVMQG